MLRLSGVNYAALWLEPPSRVPALRLEGIECNAVSTTRRFMNLVDPVYMVRRADLLEG